MYNKRWHYYVVDIPMNDQGDGPVSIREATQISYQVWDVNMIKIREFEFLFQAIEEAVRLNIEDKIEGWV